MKVTAKRTNTKVTTGKVRLSYAHLFEASSIEGNDPKFSTAILIPKTEIETIKCIREATIEAAEMGKAKLGKYILATLKTPLRNGDVEHPDDDTYKGMYFLNASSKNRPGIVDSNVQPILDASEVYSGCYARLTINFYAYSASGNKGIAAGLGNVQKLAEGESLGGFARAENDFDSVETSNADFLG